MTGEIDQDRLHHYKDALETVNGIALVKLLPDPGKVLEVTYLKGGEPEEAQNLLDELMEEMDLDVMEYDRSWTGVNLVLAPSGYWRLPDQYELEEEDD